MGLNIVSLNCLYYAIDYMLGTMFLGYYLLFILLILIILNNYLSQIDAKRRNLITLLSINSENFNKPVIMKKYTNIQSAENCKGFSETIRQLSKFTSDDKFYRWFAGVIDGDGNFDVRQINSKLVLKSIRIKLHDRDVRILTRIQNYLHIGKIRSDKQKPFSIYTISRSEDLFFIVNKLNGLIRIKVDGLRKACFYLNIDYIEPNYNIEEFDPYLSGLVDTDGTIVFNYNCNRIECNLEFKYNEYTNKLNFDKVIPYYKPSILLREKTNQTSRITSVRFKSIAFKYQTVKGMVYLYDYFMENRLYSDFKFYRVSQIKKFITIRNFNNEPKDSVEFKIYSDFLFNWIQYRNPLWYKVPFVSKLR